MLANANFWNDILLHGHLVPFPEYTLPIFQKKSHKLYYPIKTISPVGFYF